MSRERLPQPENSIPVKCLGLWVIWDGRSVHGEVKPTRLMLIERHASGTYSGVPENEAGAYTYEGSNIDPETHASRDTVRVPLGKYGAIGSFKPEEILSVSDQVEPIENVIDIYAAGYANLFANLPEERRRELAEQDIERIQAQQDAQAATQSPG